MNDATAQHGKIGAMRSRRSVHYGRYLLAGLLGVLVVIGTAVAAGQYGLQSAVSSGGTSAGGSYALLAAVGQPAAGFAQGDAYTICSGYGCVAHTRATPTQFAATPLPPTPTSVNQPNGTPTAEPPTAEPPTPEMGTPTVDAPPTATPGITATGSSTAVPGNGTPTPESTPTPTPPVPTPTVAVGTETPLPQSVEPASSIYLPIVLR